ncbi:hypothetical protein EB118_22465 [bacterium]|nr:hypothetical protein [bacterium]NDG32820.1 hypothetical protein [bacterium]
MTDKEKLIESHLQSLSAHYGDRLNGMKFACPIFEDRESVVSISESKKEAYLTRHHIAGHYLSQFPTHVVILAGDCFDRI